VKKPSFIVFPQRIIDLITGLATIAFSAELIYPGLSHQDS
jgi:hypothetical protein